MTSNSGLVFFPLDVNFFLDKKMRHVTARFGLKGEAITLRILCAVYRNGYYLVWQNAGLLFSQGVVGEGHHSLANDVALELIKRGFFDRSIFDRFGILTSHGIQENYIVVARKRKTVTEMHGELLLADVSGCGLIKVVWGKLDTPGSVEKTPQRCITTIEGKRKKTPILHREENKREENNIKHTPPPTRTVEAGVGVITKNSSMMELEAGFNQLWDLYPNKDNEFAARREFYKAIKSGAIYEDIKQGICRYKAHVEATVTEKRYVAHFSTWLKDRRWNDKHELSVQLAKPKPASKFHNFSQREYDWADLERREREHIDKKHGFTYVDGKLVVSGGKEGKTENSTNSGDL